MSHRFFTLLVVRRRVPGFSKLRLSYPFAVCAALLLVLLVVAGLLAPGMLLELGTQSIALERLRHENERLASENGYFESALGQMGRRIGAFEVQAERIARELGLPEPAAPAGGEHLADRAAERFPLEGELRYLQSRTEGLDRSFERLDDAFGARMQELRARPAGMPVAGWLSDGFGWRKDPWTGEREFHQGIDIVSDEGVEILAPADGVVALAGRYADYGQSVDIDHGYGFVTRYAHLSQMLVKPGERVRRGEAIARVGSSGRATGPHLHYEVFRDGRRVDPRSYLGHKAR